MTDDGLEQTGTLVSVQVGQPVRMEFRGKVWESAIGKGPVVGRVWLDATHLEGDRQHNLKYHGGPDKTVCCFCAEHYPALKQEFDLDERFTYGAFGENFTVSGMLETDVCIGDVYTVGGARVQVSQPRQPCVNVARKWDRKTLPVRMETLGYTGYYLRVLGEGEVGAGDTVSLVERPHPDLSVHRLNRAMYQHESTLEQDALLARLPVLASSIRRLFQRRLKMVNA